MKFFINIWQDLASDSVKIVFIDKNSERRLIMNLYTGQLIEIKAGEQIPDEYIIKLPNFMASVLLQTLAETLDKHNIKTDKDAKIQGTLEATKKHLEDMRRLVFKQTRVERKEAQ